MVVPSLALSEIFAFGQDNSNIAIPGSLNTNHSGKKQNRRQAKHAYKPDRNAQQVGQQGTHLPQCAPGVPPTAEESCCNQYNGDNRQIYTLQNVFAFGLCGLVLVGPGNRFLC